MEEIKRTIDVIKNDPLAKVIIVGDLIENITKLSKGNIYQQDITPTEQLQIITDLLRPIRDKIIGITQGNHENRSDESGIEITKLLAYNLGLLELYCREGIYIFLSFGIKDCKQNCRHTFRIYAKHMGGIDPRKMKDVCNADLYVSGHTHNFKHFIEGYYEGSERIDGVLTLKTRAFVVTTSYLNYGGYAEDKNYTPSVISQPVIDLSYTTKDKKERKIIQVTEMI